MAEQLIWQMMTGTDAGEFVFISCRKKTFLVVQQQLFEGLSEILYRAHARSAVYNRSFKLTYIQLLPPYFIIIKHNSAAPETWPRARTPFFASREKHRQIYDNG